jgi:hypothetical protein
MIRSPLILAALALSLLLGGCGSRSIGNKIDDQFVGPEVASAVAKAHGDLASPQSHIVVSSYNGVILLAGQTPRNELKSIAGQAAQRVEGVHKVHNELQIQQPSSLLARSNDSLLTTKIKTQMLTDSGVPGSRIKVSAVRKPMPQAMWYRGSRAYRKSSNCSSTLTNIPPAQRGNPSRPPPRGQLEPPRQRPHRADASPEAINVKLARMKDPPLHCGAVAQSHTAHRAVSVNRNPPRR